VIEWHDEADVVVIGSGAMGMPAAIAARESRLDVIVVEAESDIGGHAITSGGNIPLGGGTPAQKKYGIVDSPELIYEDLTDWSIVEPNGHADYRYNDKEIVRAFADENVHAYGWLIQHGVVFVDQAPDNRGGNATGNSAPREMHAAAMNWPLVQTGAPAPFELAPTMSSGNGLMRPLEAAARRAGVRILLEHRMTSIHRESATSGRVLGISARVGGKIRNIRARNAVIVATGGAQGNVEFRRMFDPRLTEEYCGLAGMPWSDQDASGELAAMAIGASLWGLANQTAEFGWQITKPGLIGCQYNYVNLQWMPGSPVFHKARASGLRVKDWQNIALVNMLGRRFYDETGTHFTSNSHNSIVNYKPRDHRNAQNILTGQQNWLNAALGGVGEMRNGGGPIWAIFDAAAVEREGWDPQPPNVDRAAGFFFNAKTIEELAAAVVMPHQRLPMLGEELRATIERYNSFVDSGSDDDFGKPAPQYKIAKPPFYAAWATPVLHDSLSGLRINAKCQVMDLRGEVIPGLFCGGESAGGFSQHGLARAICQGLIAARNAAASLE
jgi:succinate dehydrogenase/fumarate reductase flavoprotein subunit